MLHDAGDVLIGARTDGESSVGAERWSLVCESSFRCRRRQQFWKGSSLRVQGIRAWGPCQPSLPRIQSEVCLGLFLFSYLECVSGWNHLVPHTTWNDKKQFLPKVIWEECIATPYGRECTRLLRVLAVSTADSFSYLAMCMLHPYHFRPLTHWSITVTFTLTLTLLTVLILQLLASIVQAWM